MSVAPPFLLRATFLASQRERVENGGRPDRQAAKPHADSGEDRITDCRGNNRRRWLAEANGSLCTVNELHIKLGHIANAQGRVAIEVRILHLTGNEFSAFVKRHTEAPKDAALNLCQRAVWVYQSAGVYNNRQLLDGDSTIAAVDPDTRDASAPGRHAAFLAKCGCNAKACIFR